MEKQQSKIVAIITMTPEKVQGGGAPVFVVTDQKELQGTSMTLEKIMDASAHEVDVDTLIIVAR